MEGRVTVVRGFSRGGDIMASRTVAFLEILLAHATIVSCNAGENRSRLLIVGAGVSGLGAASRLMERGFSDFRILEAENRIGGRVHTVPFGEDVMIDYGAHWVHGGPGNPVYDLAAPLGLVEESGDFAAVTCVFSDGTTELRIKYPEHDADGDIPYNVSLKEAFLNRAGEAVRKVLRGEKAEAYLKQVVKLECTSEGCDNLDDVSARMSNEFLLLNSSQSFGWKGKGYRSVIDLVLRKHPKSKGPPIELGDRLLLNSEVKSIKVLESGGVQVECSDGGVHLADLVLVTVSAGVLKERHQTLFQPALPTSKQAAINALGFGTIDKIILRFPTAWWPANSSGFQLVWLEENKGAYKGEYSWETEVLAFVTERWSPYSLTGWIIGEAAREMERTPLDGVQRGAMRIIRHFLGANYTVPEPVQIIRSSWGTNPHFRGSYSYRRLEAERHNVSYIATPLLDNDNKEVVFFAGEATHPYFFSTVHGALASGWREADRILGRVAPAS